MNSQEIERLRTSVVAANQELVAAGLVLCTWGNVSGIDRSEGIVAIKPSGVPYDQLSSSTLPLVKLEDGTSIGGDLRPSSDLPTHLELYRAFPDIGGIAHTHSVCATSFAQAQKGLPCLGTTHADHFHGTIPVTRPLTRDEIATDYEVNTGKVIVEAFASLSPTRMPAVLVAQHGPFTWGRTPAEAVLNSIVLEAVADMALKTLSLRTDSAAIHEALLDKHFLRKHGNSAYYGQTQDRYGGNGGRP